LIEGERSGLASVAPGGDLDEGGDVAVQVLLADGVGEGCDEDLVDAVDGGGRQAHSAALPDRAAAGCLPAAFLVLGAALAGGLQLGDEAAHVGDGELVEVDAAEAGDEVDVHNWDVAKNAGRWHCDLRKCCHFGMAWI